MGLIAIGRLLYITCPFFFLVMFKGERSHVFFLPGHTLKFIGYSRVQVFLNLLTVKSKDFRLFSATVPNLKDSMLFDP